jgi:hypothetical protein
MNILTVEITKARAPPIRARVSPGDGWRILLFIILLRLFFF